jgi:hypothetical protein
MVRLRVTACLVLVSAAVAVAGSQDLPKMNTGESDVFPTVRVQPRTPVQQIADRLKLDPKTQLPAFEQIVSEAMKEAAPVGQEMLQLRQQIVNLELAKKVPEMQAAVDAYAAAAQKMTGIEARAFAKVYATLKPTQQSNASQAFALMAGIFQPSMSGGGRGRRGGAGQ